MEIIMEMAAQEITMQEIAAQAVKMRAITEKIMAEEATAIMAEETETQITAMEGRIARQYSRLMYQSLLQAIHLILPEAIRNRQPQPEGR